VQVAGALDRLRRAVLVVERVQVLDPDGGFFTSWPVVAWAPGSEPFVAVGADENVFISDPPGSAVLELTFEGRPVRRYTADSAGKPFFVPSGLALDRKNRMLYVINSGSSSVSTISLAERTKK